MKIYVHTLNVILNISEKVFFVVSRSAVLEGAIELMSNTSLSWANCRSSNGVSVWNGHSVRTICLLKCLPRSRVSSAHVCIDNVQVSETLNSPLSEGHCCRSSSATPFLQQWREQLRKAWDQLWSMKKLIKAKQKVSSIEHEEIN